MNIPNTCSEVWAKTWTYRIIGLAQREAHAVQTKSSCYPEEQRHEHLYRKPECIGSSPFSSFGLTKWTALWYTEDHKCKLTAYRKIGTWIYTRIYCRLLMMLTFRLESYRQLPLPSELCQLIYRAPALLSSRETDCLAASNSWRHSWGTFRGFSCLQYKNIQTNSSRCFWLWNIYF
jgi:hypothetical protein